jgi:hypothetical protein
VDTAFGVLKSAVPTIIAVASTIGGALVTAFSAMAGAVSAWRWAPCHGIQRGGGSCPDCGAGHHHRGFQVEGGVRGRRVHRRRLQGGVLAARRYRTGLPRRGSGRDAGVMAQVINVFRTAWGVVKAVFGGAFTAIKGITLGFGQALHGVIEIIGGILKGDFGQIWNGVKDIFKGAGTDPDGNREGLGAGVRRRDFLHRLRHQERVQVRVR